MEFSIGQVGTDQLVALIRSNTTKLRGRSKAMTTKRILKETCGQANHLGTVTMSWIIQWTIRSQALRS